MNQRELPRPPHYDPAGVGQIWHPDTQALAAAAGTWRDRFGLNPASEDGRRIAMLLVDVQNSFCTPGFELFVAGRSGSGAVDDNRRLCDFLYRHVGIISQITATMDTHFPYQVFHPSFWIDAEGQHPAPFTQVSSGDIESGRWSVDPEASAAIGIELDYLQRYVRHYTHTLETGGKYDLTIWPYHVLLGSPGHALVSSVQEAVFFHTLARRVQPVFHVKGDNPLTEHYSVLGPEVTTDPEGNEISSKDTSFVDQLLGFDRIVVAGQAKSHCLAWTISDLLESIELRDRRLAEKVYLLEDCTSPVVVPGAFDYTEEADEAFRRFERAGMKVVRSAEPMDEWPGVGILT